MVSYCRVSTVFLCLALVLGCGGESQFERMARMKAERAANEGTAEDAAVAVQPAPQSAKEPTVQVVPAENANRPDNVAPEKQASDDNSTETQETEEAVTSDIPDTPLDEEAHRKNVVANLEKIGEAIDRYFKKNGRYPRYTFNKKNEYCLSWRVVILPELGYQDLFEQFNLSEPYDSPGNLRAAKQIPREYMDLTDSIPDGHTRILGSVGGGTAIGLMDVESLDLGVMKEEGYDAGTFITAYEAHKNNAVLWTSNNDPVFRSDQTPPFTPDVYETGGYVLFGDGLVREVNPDASLENLKSLFDFASPCYRNRFTHAPFVVPAGDSTDPLVADSEDSAGPEDNDDPIQEILVGQTISREELAAQQEAERIARTGLIFDATDKYVLGSRFSDAKLTHLASLIIGDEDLNQRCRWSSVLKRPIYGFDLVLGVIDKGSREIDRIPLSLKETPEQMDFAEDFFYEEYGKPGFLLIDLLKKARASGVFGAWNQALDLSKSEVTEIAKESGDLIPGVVFAPRYNKVGSMLDFANRQNAELLLVLTIERAGETKIKAELFDAQRRKPLGNTGTLSTSDYAMHLRSPLSQDPVDKWLQQIATLLADNTRTEPLPSLSVGQARDLVRSTMRRDGEINRLKDILNSKLFFQMGLISAVEHGKVTAGLLDTPQADNITSKNVYERLEVIESLLPIDWEKPKGQLREVDED